MSKTLALIYVKRLFLILGLSATVFLTLVSYVHNEVRQKNGIEIAISRSRSYVRKYGHILNSTIPQTVFILSTWRSGSSFFGEACSAHPAVYYHFEPLREVIGNNRVEVGMTIQKAVQTLRNLSTCQFPTGKNRLSLLRRFHFLLKNGKIRKHCGKIQHLCLDPNFLSETCQPFPVQAFKLIRLYGKAVHDLVLEFPAAKIIYLFRDPRSIYASRLKIQDAWCENSCKSIDLLCTQLTRDLGEIQALESKQANHVHVVKYEQLALSPERSLRSIYKFLGLTWHEAVGAHIASHTHTEESDQPYSTFRNSSAHVDSWRISLEGASVLRIEAECRQFMTALNYTFSESSGVDAKAEA